MNNADFLRQFDGLQDYADVDAYLPQDEDEDDGWAYERYRDGCDCYGCHGDGYGYGYDSGCRGSRYHEEAEAEAEAEEAGCRGPGYQVTDSEDEDDGYVFERYRDEVVEVGAAEAAVEKAAEEAAEKAAEVDDNDDNYVFYADEPAAAEEAAQETAASIIEATKTIHMWLDLFLLAQNTDQKIFILKGLFNHILQSEALLADARHVGFLVAVAKKVAEVRAHPIYAGPLRALMIRTELMLVMIDPSIVRILCAPPSTAPAPVTSPAPLPSPLPSPSLRRSPRIAALASKKEKSA